MRIGFDAKRAFVNASGLGNYSRNLLNALHLYSGEYQLVLYTPEIKTHLLKEQERFEIHSPEKSLAKIFSQVWRNYGANRIKKHKISLFHGLSNELPKGIHKTGIPSIVTIHDLIFLRFPGFYPYIDRKIYYSKVKYACQSANKIIAISQQTKDDIIRFFGVDPEKIEIIYQPVSDAFFKPDIALGEKLLNKYSLRPDFILSVGTLEPRKNQLAILKAIQKGKFTNQVVFIGKQQSYKHKLDRFIAENKLEKQVVFLHNLPEEELAALYKMAGCSVYISLFEGFGLPVIESMASGCPVITSNVSVLPETAGDAALLCEPGDIDGLVENLKIFLENYKERIKWIEKGFDRANLFNSRDFAVKMAHLYDSIQIQS